MATGRRSFPADANVRRTYEAIRLGYARLLLRKTLDSLKHDKRVDNYLRAADLLRTLGQWEKALSILQKVRPTYPDHWGIEFAVGQVYFSLFRKSRHPADLTECLDGLRRANELNPGNYKVLFFLALTCARVKLFNEALSAVEAILSAIPADQRALALEVQIRRLQAEEQSREELEAPLADRQDGAAGTDPTPAPPEAITRFIAKASEIPESIGVLAFDSSGNVIGTHFKQNSLFDLTNCDEPARAMAVTCRVDADRIGIGSLQSCVMCGETWQVVIRAVDDMDVVAFLEGTKAAPMLEALSDQIMIQAN